MHLLRLLLQKPIWLPNIYEQGVPGRNWTTECHSQPCASERPTLSRGEETDGQVKTTRRRHLPPARTATIDKSTNSKCWQGCGERGDLVRYWWECALGQPLWEAVWSFLKKLKNRTIFWEYILRTPKYPFERICAPLGSLQCYLQ